MPKLRPLLFYWLPVLAWMCLIFTASSDSHSFHRSSRIIEPVLRWIFPHITDAAVNTIVTIARKCAHMTEYAVLALLIWRALRKPVRSDPRGWSWSEARLALLIVALYAATDEFHQLFVPTRDAAVHDVMIDTLGAAWGLLLWRMVRFRRERKPARTLQAGEPSKT